MIHQGGSNFSFCGGHAKWEQVEATWTQWHADATEVEGDPTGGDTRKTQGEGG